MNNEDIDNAIQFLAVRDHIVLQCLDSNSVGLIKRQLFKVKGMPRKILGYNLHYGHQVIKIMVLKHPDDTKGYDENECFFIRRDDRDDAILLERGFKLV